MSGRRLALGFGAVRGGSVSGTVSVASLPCIRHIRGPGMSGSGPEAELRPHAEKLIWYLAFGGCQKSDHDLNPGTCPACEKPWTYGWLTTQDCSMLCFVLIKIFKNTSPSTLLRPTATNLKNESSSMLKTNARWEPDFCEPAANLMIAQTPAARRGTDHGRNLHRAAR